MMNINKHWLIIWSGLDGATADARKNGWLTAKG